MSLVMNTRSRGDTDSQENILTRMHSSRMCTACSLLYGGLPDRPPGQRPTRQRPPRQRPRPSPCGQTDICENISAVHVGLPIRVHIGVAIGVHIGLCIGPVYNLRLPFNLSIRISNSKSNLSR